MIPSLFTGQERDAKRNKLEGTLQVLDKSGKTGCGEQPTLVAQQPDDAQQCAASCLL